MKVSGIERKPEWKALHMTLYEVALPEPAGDDPNKSRERPLKELISAMEQFYSGMLSVSAADADEPRISRWSLRYPLTARNSSFMSRVPNHKRDLFGEADTFDIPRRANRGAAE